MERLISFFGLLAMIGLAWLISENRRKMNWRLIASGFVLQLALAAVLLGTPLKQAVFDFVEVMMTGLIACSDEGARFVYGDFFYSEGYIEQYHAPPFVVSVMSAVIFFSALTAVLFHLGILQRIVGAMARVMVWVMDVSGAESLCTAANVFVGMTTAPLAIKPYLATMTRSELMAMMTGGMATVAGGTMVAYVGMAEAAGIAPGELAGHLMVASLISAPASLVIAKIMVPETEPSVTKGTVKIDVPRTDANVLDAACRGAGEGLKLVLNIVAMLIAFIALVYLVNWMLFGLSQAVNEGLAAFEATENMTVQQMLGGRELTLELILGWLCAPLAWIMGIEWKDAHTVGVLIAEKTIFNEFVAYEQLMKFKDLLSPRSFTIATYALCGFANFGSIAMMIGGVSGLAPQRRRDFARYGFRSMIGGALAAFMTAAIAGMLI